MPYGNALLTKDNPLFQQTLEAQQFGVAQMEHLDANPEVRLWDMDENTWGPTITLPKGDKKAQDRLLAYHLGLTSKDSTRCTKCEGVGRWKKIDGQDDLIPFYVEIDRSRLPRGVEIRIHRCPTCQGKGRIPGPRWGQPKFSLQPPAVSPEASAAPEQGNKKRRRRRRR